MVHYRLFVLLFCLVSFLSSFFPLTIGSSVIRLLSMWYNGRINVDFWGSKNPIIIYIIYRERETYVDNSSYLSPIIDLSPFCEKKTLPCEILHISTKNHFDSEKQSEIINTRIHTCVGESGVYVYRCSYIK